MNNTPEHNNGESKPTAKEYVISFAFIALIILAIIVVYMWLFTDFHFHVWRDADCINPKYCTRCEKIVGERLGHDYKEPTCTEYGTCQRCGDEDYFSKPLGHIIENATLEKEPTCSTPGIEKGICKRCDKTASKEIPKTAHAESTDWIFDDDEPADQVMIYTKRCTVCNEKIDTKRTVLTDKEHKEMYVGLCKKYTYNEVAREPEEYKGEYAYFKGEVMQVVQQESSSTHSYLLVNVTNNGYFWTDLMFIDCYRGPEGSRFLKDDVVTFYGVLDGEFSYTTALGTENTVPRFEAQFYTIH